MDLQKAKIHLDKINREFARMSRDPENIVRIERDIMLANVRELYDAFLSNEITAAPKPAPAPPKMAEPVPVAPPPRPVAAPEFVPAPPPVVVETPRPVPPPEPPVQVPEPIKIAPRLPVSEPVAPPIQEAPPAPKPAPAPVPPAKSPTDAEVLFEQKQARELSEKLAETPIADLRRGIALNDRLLFASELFGKNSQAFDEALTALNSFSGFEQAKDYLIDHCVGRFDWLEKSRAERAKEFIRLVRRRFK